MKRKHMALLAIVPLVIGVGGATAVAQVDGNEAGDFRRQGQFEERRERWIEVLDLTEEQQIEIQAIREQARTSNAPLREQLEQARDTMRSLLAEDASNSQIRQQHDQVQQLQQQLGDAMLDFRLAIRDVLTEEQRTQLAELMPEHPHRGGGVHSRHGGRGFQN